MPGIIEFPKVVQDALDQYGDLFANQSQRRHLAEYLTGLFVARAEDRPWESMTNSPRPPISPVSTGS